VVEPAALRVGTWNLASGRLVDGRPASAERLAEAVRSLDVDVLAVQELDRHQPRSGAQDQLAVVAEALGAADARYVPTLAGRPGPGRAWRAIADDDVPDGPTYGIGLVSRLPVRDWRVRRLGASRAVLPMALPGPGGRARVVLIADEPRVAVAAVVEGPSGLVTVVSTHLSFAPTVSLRQLRTLRRWVRSLPGPVVVAGDLNLPGRVPSWLTGWRPLVSARTYPAADPRVQLDHLLLAAADGGRLPALATGLLGRRGPVSDHLPLVATLTAAP
jgi:endonuclease/exonuclease/phosphatase family metal-dependent hydrolase